MAAIHDPEEEVDLSKLAVEVKSQLPTFAWPLFVRLVKTLDITGTYIKKNQITFDRPEGQLNKPIAVFRACTVPTLPRKNMNLPYSIRMY